MRKAKPSDKDAQKKFDECQKIVKRIAFEKAISCDENKSVAETIDIYKIRTKFELVYFIYDLLFLEVDEGYKGPYLELDISKDFMEKLIELYKNQGKLHAKYAYKVC